MSENVALETEQYLSDKQLAKRYDVTRVTLWRWARDSSFPKPVRLSSGCSRWKMSEILRWESQT